MTRRLFIGCPVWACDDWVGSLYPSKDRSTWLRRYSSVFNTVEGNSVFYGLPSIETARRWGEAVAPGFRFSLKFPRVISHDRRLANAESETERFLEVLQTLDRFDCLGPSFLQLPPNFSGNQFGILETYLRSLPPHFPFALEVRHADYFDGHATESRLDDLLRELNIDRCLFDSRPLFSSQPSDEFETESQRRKPRSPYRTTVTGKHPMLRFVGRNDVTKEVVPWIEEWAPIIAHWLDAGLEPFVFAHSPGDKFAPQFAARLYNEIRRHAADLPPLQQWEKPSTQTQKNLF
ncbi:MAG: DUF72 domain-containing protein [Planctomycetaceae bacterium]